MTHHGVPVVLLWLLFGCASPSTPSRLPNYLLKTEVSPQQRLQVLKQMGPIELHHQPQSYEGVLYQLLASDGQPDAMRELAIDRLVAFDQVAFHRWIQQNIEQINRWPVLEHLFALAVERQWLTFTRVAITSYARPSRVYDDEHRPEREVIAKLNPDVTVEDAVFEVFDSPDDVSSSQRIAAWTLLCRLEEPSPRLAQATSDSPVVEHLKEADSVLNVLPTTPYSYAMLAMAYTSGSWQLACERMAHWPAEARQDLSLRHLMLRSKLNEPLASRHAILMSIQSRLENAKHVERHANGAESLVHQPSQLSWSDLVVIHFVLEAMTQPTVIATWFAQADADLADEGTEHGGVITYTNDHAVAVGYKPDLRVHDRQFIASPQLLARVAEGGVHYHFHAQAYRNGQYAGPGDGDLAFVDRYDLGAIVLTFVDRDTLNVDYYQPTGIVIDLGCITR